jgi:hypothetical protein
MFVLVFIGRVLETIWEYASGIAEHRNRAATVGGGCDVYFENSEQEHTWHFLAEESQWRA